MPAKPLAEAELGSCELERRGKASVKLDRPTKMLLEVRLAVEQSAAAGKAAATSQFVPS